MKIIQKALSIVLSLTLFAGIFSAANAVVYAAPENAAVSGDGSNVVYSGRCGNSVTWTLTENGTLTVSGTGGIWGYEDEDDEMPGVEPPRAPWYGKYVKSVIIEPGITSVGAYAFYSMKNMDQLSLPSTLTDIENDAFSYCSALKQLTLPEGLKTIGVRAFCNCEGIETLVFPNKVESIGAFAFGYCNNLSYVYIPASVTKINFDSFARDYALKSIVIDSANKVYDSRENCNAIIETRTNKLIEGFGISTIPNGVKTIGRYAFERCGNLKSVILPPSVETIEFYAFDYCANLETLSLNNGLKSIGNYAFNYNTKIKNLILPDTLTSIGIDAFYGCSSVENLKLSSGIKTIVKGAFSQFTSLENLTIPNGVETIEANAFLGCNKIESIFIPASVSKIYGNSIFSKSLSEITVSPDNPTYDSRGNCNAIINTATGELTMGCKNTVIPDDVTGIGGYAFYFCEELNKVELPDTVTYIGERAFYNCEGIKKLVFSNNLEEIGTYAFYGCTNLITIKMPDSVTKLGDAAFYYCAKLTGVKLSANITEIPNKLFYSCYELENVIIPEGVTKIGADVFTFCKNFKRLVLPRSLEIFDDYLYRSTGEGNEKYEFFYPGSEEDWNGVKYDRRYGFQPSNVNFHFNYSAPQTGDSDLDGSIAISDATSVQYYLVGFVDYSHEQHFSADANGDGGIDIGDATEIQKYLAGFDSELS